jgi:16S rRNA (guanine966-N2)-methyltransferase
MFARLGELTGHRVLDLFAGTGALGIEAISRGAESTLFVDSSARSLAALQKNLNSLELGAACQVLRCDASAAVRRLGDAGERFDLVFLDPPYAADEIPTTLVALVEAEVLAADATVVVETATRDAAALNEPIQGLRFLDSRRYGDTTIVRFTESQGEARS